VDRGWTILVRCAGVLAALALSKEQLELRTIPLGEEWVARRIAKVIELAARLEVGVTLAARDLSPREEWMGAPEWFRPTHERETAPAG
jgi:hypothetical protein